MGKRFEEPNDSDKQASADQAPPAAITDQPQPPPIPSANPQPPLADPSVQPGVTSPTAQAGSPNAQPAPEPDGENDDDEEDEDEPLNADAEHALHAQAAQDVPAVAIDVFIGSHASKPDQLAGFRAFASTNLGSRYTIPEWEQHYSEFTQRATQ